MRAPTLVGVGAGLVVAIAVLAAALLLLPPAVEAPGPAPSSGTPTAAASVSAAGRSPAGGAPPPMASGGAAGSAAGIGLPIGRYAPPLRLVALDGSAIDLASLRGRPVWIDFLASWAPACQDELPLVEKYHAELGQRVAIILVDVRESQATAAAFENRMKLDLPVGLDLNGAAQHAWAAYSLPIHYWIDAFGVVRASGYGGLSSSQMLDGLHQVLPAASASP